MHSIPKKYNPSSIRNYNLEGSWSWSWSCPEKRRRRRCTKHQGASPSGGRTSRNARILILLKGSRNPHRVEVMDLVGVEDPIFWFVRINRIVESGWWFRASLAMTREERQGWWYAKPLWMINDRLPSSTQVYPSHTQVVPRAASLLAAQLVIREPSIKFEINNFDTTDPT